MCFASSSPAPVVSQPQEAVVRHQADASLTKNTQDNFSLKGYKQNLKTAPLGLIDSNPTDKKTLLGE